MERQDFIEGLRQLADIYDRNPQLDVPSYLPTWWIFTFDAETFVRQIGAFGSGAKKYDGEDIQFIPNVLLDLKIQCKREKICERRVVARRMVPEKRIPETVIPAHEEEVVEWDCRPVLAAAKAPVQINTEPDLIATGVDVVDIPF